MVHHTFKAAATTLFSAQHHRPCTNQSAHW